MANISLWKSTAAPPAYQPLEGDYQADVAIIGGGITGITCAYLLATRNMKVVVAEAYEAGGGDTGNSTGNLYAPVGEYYHKLRGRYGQETLHRVAASRSSAVDFIENTSAHFQIPCHFGRHPWHLYITDLEQERLLEDELAALREAYLDAEEAFDIPLPYPIRRAIRLNHQAQFNPYLYIRGLCEVVASLGGVIGEHSPVLKIEEGDPHALETASARIRARHVVHASHIPKGFHLVQATLGPYREYGVAARLDTPLPPQGIYWSADANRYSTRSYESDAGSFLVVIGETHKVGQKEDTRARYEALEAFVRGHYSVAEFTHRWSAQQYKSGDLLPLIGESGDNIYIAAGFAADGLTYGTLAGIIIGDLITTGSSRWEDLYAPKRITPALSGRFLKENVNVAGYYIKDYLFNKDLETVSAVRAGEGSLVEVEGEKLCAYRDESDRLHLLSPVCTHLKCIVHFNNAEKTWDCPCHGSRFSVEGEVIQGPAIEPLKRIGVRPAEAAPPEAEPGSPMAEEQP